MALQQETLRELATRVCTMANDSFNKAAQIQETIFGPEPSEAGGPKSPTDTVESLLREAIDTIGHMTALQDRVLGRIGVSTPPQSYAGSGYGEKMR